MRSPRNLWLHLGCQCSHGDKFCHSHSEGQSCKREDEISRRWETAVENLYTARGSSLLSMKEPDEEAQAVQNTTPGTELQHNALGNSLWLEKDGM